jgi:hypothetical protein
MPPGRRSCRPIGIALLKESVLEAGKGGMSGVERFSRDGGDIKHAVGQLRGRLPAPKFQHVVE